ncbi:MAG TPA: MG2 domain-containing protein [Planctomycetota bacterium]|jgi:hypothetical protein|nr:MG2 domain-containing protein [Planctomycetota bacterium]
MNACESTKELLLDHLYGALDEPEETAVRDHLAACEACRAALAMAREQRELLAEAARLPVNDFAFTSPPASSPIPIRFTGFRRVGAAAAAALLGAAGVFGYRAHARAQILARNPRVSVLGPVAVPSGSPAQFLVDVRTLDGDPLRAEVSGEVQRADGRETQQALTDGNGEARLSVNSGSGRPGEQMLVGFRVKTPDGIERHGSTMLVRDATRLLARVGTDKPLYRPGEPVRVRAVALERFRLTPAGDLPVRFQVFDPRGSLLADPTVPAIAGVGAWTWPIPDGAAGGEYRVVLTGDPGGFETFPKTERKFVVRSYRVPRIKGDIDFDRDAYGPGATGEATVSVERAEGGVPRGAALDAIVTVDGKEDSRETLALPDTGNAKVRFTLPKEIEQGRGTLTVVVRDGGNVETLAKTLPIVIDRLDVAFFPEGGDLVAGLPSRVYFSVRDPKDEPADLEAEVVDSRGREVAEAKVEDLGRGRFELTPKAGETYRLVARRPERVELRAAFPAVNDRGVVVRALDDVTPPGAPLRLEVASTESGRHDVAAYCRGVLVAQDTVRFAAGESREVALRANADVGGVFRVTVFDPAGSPRAERLVSVEPPHRVDLEIRPSVAAASPGDTVKVDLLARDENGRPARAVLGVGVVDDAVVSLAKDEDTPSLPMHFLLGLEVEELEKVDVFARGPNAARAVDRLLGVQGWRHFAWREPAAFLANNAEKGPRVVVASAVDTPQRSDNEAEVRIAVEAGMSQVDERLRRRAGVLAIAGGIVFGLVRLVSGLAARRPLRVGTALAGGTLAVLLGITLNPGGFEERPAVVGGLPGNLRFEAPVVAVANAAQRPGSDGFRSSWTSFFAGESQSPSPGGAWGSGGANLLVLRADRPVVEFFQDAIAGPPEMRANLWRFEEPNEDLELAAGRDDFIVGRRMPGPTAPGHARFLAREYAHRKRPNHDGSRQDFTEVLYWNPNLVTGEDGKAHFEFDTSDSVTTFAVGVEAHDARGALAAESGEFRNRIPFFLEPKVPVALSAGDRLLLPVVAANDTDAAADVQVGLEIAGDFLRLDGQAGRTVRVEAGNRGRAIFELQAGHGRGNAGLTFTGRDPRGFQDRSVRSIPIVPRGYPIEIARGGTLEKRDAATISLPVDLDRTTLSGSLRLYPSVLSTLVDGLDAMLQQPGGCFEQASSSNYPNVLVLTYLAEQEAAAPEVARRAKDLLAKGYGLLAGYECKQRGYEWFGGDPGHEALSAYGLMEFADMSRVHAVDAAMVARTRDWLLARRDGKGGFLRNDRALDSFGRAPADLTDAYIVWAVTEADAGIDLAREIASVEERARASDDPYLVALAANALANRNAPGAKTLLDRLASMQAEDGRLAGKRTSITSSTGPNLDVETTALAAMAFVTDPARLPNAEQAVRWLVAQRQGGRFGATQATILALRALVEHGRATRRTACDHDLKVTVNGRTVATRHVPAGSPGAVSFEREMLEALVPGENRVEIETTGAETLPWAIALRYHTNAPPSDPGCAVEISTALDREVVAEGETARMDVTLRNRRAEGVPMTLVRIGLPAGLEPRPDQLKEWKEQGLVDAYETRPREVTLYYRGLAPSAEKRLALDLVAAIPGEFEGPATSAYLYYSDDRKAWAAPARVRIDPAGVR